MPRPLSTRTSTCIYWRCSTYAQLALRTLFTLRRDLGRPEHLQRGIKAPPPPPPPGRLGHYHTHGRHRPHKVCQSGHSQKGISRTFCILSWTLISRALASGTVLLNKAWLILKLQQTYHEDDKNSCNVSTTRPISVAFLILGSRHMVTKDVLKDACLHSLCSPRNYTPNTVISFFFFSLFLDL